MNTQFRIIFFVIGIFMILAGILIYDEYQMEKIIREKKWRN